MPYGWHTEALMLSSHHWMEYTALMTVMNRFKCKQFTRKNIRDEMLTTLENLQIDLPFSPNDRFPEDKIYIDLNHSVPSRILMQLTSALDLSDRQQEKGRPGPDAVDVRSYSNLEDAKLAFYASVRAFLDLVGPLAIERAHIVGVYTRGSFESEHSLTWT